MRYILRLSYYQFNFNIPKGSLKTRCISNLTKYKSLLKSTLKSNKPQINAMPNTLKYTADQT